MIRALITAVIVGLAAALVGCGGGGGGGSGAPNPTLKAGSLDPTFGNGGVFELAATALESLQVRANSITVDAAGRLLVAGWTAPLSAASPADALVARVLPSGVVDPSFGNGGIVVTPFGGDRRSEGRWMFPAPGGGAVFVQATPAACAKIVIVPPPPPCNQFLPSQIDVLRLMADGTRDGVFGTTAFGPMLEADSRLQPDGSIIVLGMFSGLTGTGLALRRVDAGGRPDAAFAGNSDAALRCPDLAEDPTYFHMGILATSGNGKILVARKNSASTAASPIRICITRLNADGTLDASWGTAGRIYVTGPLVMGVSLVAMLERSDGGMALVLNENVAGREHFGSIAWFTATGAVDAMRGAAGITSPVALGAITAAAMQADGKIVLSGWPYDPAAVNTTSSPFAYDRPRLLRLDANGLPDTTFGVAGDGVAPLVSAGRLVHPTHIALGADGSIFAAGFTSASIMAGSGEASRLAVAKVTGAAR